MLDFPDQGVIKQMEEFDDYDEFEGLREKSARRAARFDGVDDTYDFYEEEGGFFSRFTSSQRLILAIFLVVDVLIIGYVILVLIGRLPAPF